MKYRYLTKSSHLPRQAAVIRRNTGDAPFAIWSVLNWILWLFFGYD